MSKKLNAVSIRLTEDQHTGLAKITETTGADTAFLVRTAVNGLLDYIQASGGRLQLPIDFTTAWTELHELIQSLEQTPAKKPSTQSSHSVNRPRHIGSPLDPPKDPPAPAKPAKPGNSKAG